MTLTAGWRLKSGRKPQMNRCQQQMFFRRLIVALILAATLCLTLCLSPAHTSPVPVVVDTDMALDDMRAILMLLNSQRADIPLMVVTDGISSTEKGVQNLTALLACIDRPNVRVAMGMKSQRPPPPWRGLSENIRWPKNCPSPLLPVGAEDAPTAILEAVMEEERPVVYLCLGPMTTLARAIERYPEIKSRISRVVYFGDHPQSADPGWNTAWDPEAAERVFTSGMDIYAIHPAEKDLRPFDQSMLEKIGAMGSEAARLVSMIHGGTAVQKAIHEGHLMIWDETAAIYLDHPELFHMRPASGYPRLMRLQSFDAQGVVRAYVETLFGGGGEMPNDTD